MAVAFFAIIHINIYMDKSYDLPTKEYLSSRQKEVSDILDKNLNIHFIGIGGVSMHSLAIFMARLGKNVTGSDIARNKYVDMCVTENIKVFDKHNAKNISSAQVVIMNGAIPHDNAEYAYASSHNIPIIDRAELLQYITRYFDTVIAVAGTHGKSTTSAMIYHILRQCEPRTSCHIGGDIAQARMTAGDKYLVVEACEYNKSFLSLCPNVAVVTNIEKDHLECYGSVANLKRAFEQFVSSADEKIAYFHQNTKFLGKNDVNFVGNTAKSALKYKNAKIIDEYQTFDCVVKSQPYHMAVSAYGQHNIKNAMLAIYVCRKLKVPMKIIRQGLKTFLPVGRRCEVMCKYHDNIVINDYAHHPTEIECFLKSVKDKYKRHIVCIFQPHTYSRTKLLFDDFVRVLGMPDETIIYKEYPARETKKDGYSAKYLYKSLKKHKKTSIFCKNAKNLDKLLSKYIGSSYIIVFVGAGDIEQIAKKILHTYMT